MFWRFNWLMFVFKFFWIIILIIGLFFKFKNFEFCVVIMGIIMDFIVFSSIGFFG